MGPLSSVEDGFSCSTTRIPPLMLKRALFIRDEGGWRHRRSDDGAGLDLLNLLDDSIVV